MKFFKLTRRQKIIRNCLLIGICLFLLAWMLEFPCLTKQGLLNRAERKYLLSGPTELLFEDKEEKILYARNGELLLRVNYSPILMGMQLGMTKLYPEADYLLTSYEEALDQSPYVEYSVLLVGFLEEVEYTELELTVISLDNSDKRSFILQLIGTKENEYSFRFETTESEKVRMKTWTDQFPETWWGGVKDSFKHHCFQAEGAVLRLYDGERKLLREQVYEGVLFPGNEREGRLP